jgi:hypothetical protein
MALRARSILLLLGAGFLVVFASLYLLRLQIAEELLLYALQDRGIDAAFSVTVLDGDRMTIEDLAAADGSFGAKRIDIAYRLDEVVDGKVTVVTVAGLTARVDLSEGAPSLPDLSSPEGPSADQREEETFFDLAQLDLPIITLDTATIEAETPLGPATIRASGEAWPDPSGARAGFLDFEVEAPTVGSLSGTLSAALEENGSILGDLTVEGGHLSLPAASLAGLAGQGSLAWIPGDKPALDIRLGAERFDLLEGLLPQSAFRKARLAVTLEAGALALDLGFETVDGSLTGGGRLRAGDIQSGGPLDGQMALRVMAPSPLAAAFSLPEPDGGTLALELDLQGEAPPLARLLGSDLQGIADSLTGALALSGSLRADQLSIPGRGTIDAALIDFKGDARDQRLTLHLPTPAQIVARDLDAAWLTFLGLPPSLISRLAPGVIATLTPIENGPPVLVRGLSGRSSPATTVTGHLSIESLEPGLAAQASVSLTVGHDDTPRFAATGLQAKLDAIMLAPLELSDLGISGELSGDPARLAGHLTMTGKAAGDLGGGYFLRDAAFEVPVDVTAGEAGLALRGRGPAQVSVAALAGPNELTLVKPLRLTFDDVEAALTAGTDPQLTFDGRLAAAPAVVRVRLGDERQEVRTGPISLEIQLAGPAGGNPDLRGSFSAERLDLPAHEAALTDITGDFLGSPARPDMTLRYRIGGIEHPEIARLLPPLRLDGAARLAAEIITFESEVAWPGDLRPLEVTGRLRADGGSGSLSASLGPLEFSPGSLQPDALSPLATPFTAVTGTLAADARLAWAEGDLESNGLITLENTDFVIEDIAVVGANAEIALSSLWPLAAPPGQEITLAQVDLGLLASEATAHFSLQPSAGPIPLLRLEDGGFQLLGSSINFSPQDYDFYAESQKAEIRISGLDLTRLFELLDIEGVSGTGQLNGAIPVSIGPQGFSIEKGRLAAENGVLRIASPTARQMLSGSGEQVDLLLEALEDFQYELLEFGIDKTAAQDLTARLSILGANPEVLEGHPFQLNINLSSNIENVMSALIEGYMVSNEALRRAWKLAR